MARDRAFWLNASAVAGIVLFALFVRTYWNVEAASPGETFVLSESDAYFHRHSVERVQTEGWAHPIQEPLVNYPLGGVNPNPPLMTWWIATWGALLTPVFGGDAANHQVACPADAQPSQATCVSTWWVTLFTPALFGALTTLLVILIGREIWNLRAGLLAGFLFATSTSHIERSVFGFADHDSFVLFFIVLSFLFFVKALHAARDNRWVEQWGDAASRAAGLRAYARANQLSLAYAAMAGVALAGVGLAWKGYAYGAGIFLVYGLLQVLINHWRQRDSTHVFAVVGLALLVGVLLSLPYYANPALKAVFDTLLPLVYILAAWIIIGVVFTAARDLPFVLVLPMAAAAGLVALLVAFLAAPSVAQTLLGPLVYFKQTKLYTTIAEAHPADFNTVVFGTGIVGFFIALFALPYLVWVNRKAWRPTWTFAAVWGLIALFMTHSAVRFMFNATPALALLGGWGTALIIGRLKYEAIGRNLAGLGGLSRDAIRKAINGWHIVGAVLIAFFLVLPNVLLAVDAGMPAQYEDDLIREELRAKGLPDTSANRDATFIGQRFGAFGQGFIADYWRELFEWLSTRDTDVPEAQRPAFLSWWDYGHWALSLGKHPAVADNFQNGFQFAGDFIAAQNETHTIQLMIARIADRAKAGEIEPQVVLTALQGAGLSASDAQAAYATLTDYSNPAGSHGYTPLLTKEQSAAALARLEQATGNRIRYFAVDVRLFPYDNPSTRGIDFGSIFYAPMVLGDHDPDAFVEAVYRLGGSIDGKNELTAGEFEEIQKDVRKLTQLQTQDIFPVYRYKEPFFNSMFYRTYLGTPTGLNELPATSCEVVPPAYSKQGQRIQGLEGSELPGIAMPGFCMEHWRLVYFDSSVRMLQYYPGAVVQGTVTVDGQPLEGARVVVYDDAGDMLFESTNELLTPQFKDRFLAEHGRNLTARDFDIPHAQAITGADGTYRLLAPFGLTGPVTVRAFKDDAELGSREFTITQAQAEAGHAFDPSLGLIAGTSGSVEGTVFFDANGDRAFGPGDQPLGGARVSLEGQPEVTTGPDGTFRLDRIAPGNHRIVASAPEYEAAQRLEASEVAVRSGEPTTYDIPMVLRKVDVAGTVWRDADGDGQRGEAEGITGVNVKAFPDFRQAANTAQHETKFSGDNGSLELDLTPGAYLMRGEYTDPATRQVYVLGAAREVAKGAGSVQLNATTTELVQATRATVSVTIPQGDAGNRTGAGGALALFVPTSGGLPAAERATSSGNLSLALVPGTYEVHIRATSAGQTYALAAPMTLVVGSEAVSAEARLERAASP